MRHRLILVGPLPPPVSGSSIAFKAVAHEAGAAVGRAGVEVIDLNRGVDPMRRDGAFTFGRAIGMLGHVLDLAYRLVKSIGRREVRTVYLAVAQSKFGFLRDAGFVWLSRLARARVVLHLHGGGLDRFAAGLSVYQRWLFRTTYRLAHQVILLDGHFREQLAFLPQERIAIISNDLPRATARALGSQGAVLQQRAAEERLTEPIRMVYLSNLLVSKGYLETIRSVAVLRDRFGISAELHLYGELRVDPEFPFSPEAQLLAMREELVSLSIGDLVRYEGPVFGDTKADALMAAQVFLLPTWYRNEGQPISVIEAMAAGCVPIVTEHRALPGLLAQGDAGILMSEGDAAEIAAAIAALQGAPDTFVRLRHRAIELAWTRCAPGVSAPQVLELLQGTGSTARAAQARSDLMRPCR